MKDLLTAGARKAFSRQVWSLCWRLTVGDFKQRYTGSLLGLAWTVVQPLSQILIYSFLFSQILRVRFAGHSDIPHFAAFVLAGFVPFQHLTDAMSRSVYCVRDNVMLARMGPGFPMKVLPLYHNLAALLQSLVWIALLVILAMVLGMPPRPSLLWLPMVLLPLAAFTMGLSMLVATVNVYYRDTPHFLGLLLQFWMFGTPVFYPASIIPPGLKWLVTVNPMAHFAQMSRDILLRGLAPGGWQLLSVWVVGLVTLALGYLVYDRYQGDFVDQY